MLQSLVAPLGPEGRRNRKQYHTDRLLASPEVYRSDAPITFGCGSFLYAWAILCTWKQKKKKEKAESIRNININKIANFTENTRQDRSKNTHYACCLAPEAWLFIAYCLFYSTHQAAWSKIYPSHLSHIPKGRTPRSILILNSSPLLPLFYSNFTSTGRTRYKVQAGILLSKETAAAG